MLVFLLRRLAQSVAVLWVISMLVFAGVYVIGDPVKIMVHPDATPADILKTTQALGLDQPLLTQYGRFIQAVLHGDFGYSYAYGVPALGLIVERMPATFELAIAALLIAVLLGIPLGLWAGLKPDAVSGKSIMGFTMLGFSLPSFWFGLMLIMVFSVVLGWLPANGRGATQQLLGMELSILTLDGWRNLLLPALNLALFKLALIIRLTRSATREALLQDYVRFARAKGLRESRVIGVHVLKNILVPIITVIGLEFGSLIAFSVVTESIFAWPGMGKLIIDSIQVLDRPVIVAYMLLVTTLFITINLLVDLAYALLDPRVRLNTLART